MTDRNFSDTDPLARLIHAAGRRELPPQDAYEHTLDLATQAWRAKVRGRKLRTMRRLAAGLAALLLGAGFLASQQIGAARQVAQVERVIGAVEVRAARSAAWSTVRADGRTLPRGSVVRTTDGGRLSVLLANGASLRLAAATEASFESASRIRLITGKVYLDTGGNEAAHVLVITDAGVASDVGTQFEIEYRNDHYRLSVREGDVRLQRGSTRLLSRAGEQLDIDADGEILRTPIARDAPQWRWAEALAPAPDIDNQPLTLLLDWVASETGRPLYFATPAIERKAAATILHGSIRHLAPLDALSVMLAATDLRHDLLDDGTIMIR